MKKLLIVLSLILLTSCTTIRDFNWYRSDRDPVPEENRVYFLVDDVNQVCSEFLGNSKIWGGCSLIHDNMCYVILSKWFDPRLSQIIKDHEDKHCEGWDHE